MQSQTSCNRADTNAMFSSSGVVSGFIYTGRRSFKTSIVCLDIIPREEEVRNRYKNLPSTHE